MSECSGQEVMVGFSLIYNWTPCLTYCSWYGKGARQKRPCNCIYRQHRFSGHEECTRTSRGFPGHPLQLRFSGWGPVAYSKVTASCWSWNRNAYRLGNVFLHMHAPTMGETRFFHAISMKSSRGVQDCCSYPLSVLLTILLCGYVATFDTCAFGGSVLDSGRWVGLVGMVLRCLLVHVSCKLKKWDCHYWTLSTSSIPGKGRYALLVIFVSLAGCSYISNRDLKLGCVDSWAVLSSHLWQYLNLLKSSYLSVFGVFLIPTLILSFLQSFFPQQFRFICLV